MDEFSAESNLQWAFNFVETTIARRNTGGGTDEVKYINREDLRELLTNFGDALSGEGKVIQIRGLSFLRGCFGPKSSSWLLSQY